MAMAQFFLLVGGLLSVGSLVDCSYARIDGDLERRQNNNEARKYKYVTS